VHRGPAMKTMGLQGVIAEGACGRPISDKAAPCPLDRVNATSGRKAPL